MNSVILEGDCVEVMRGMEENTRIVAESNRLMREYIEISRDLEDSPELRSSYGRNAHIKPYTRDELDAIEEADEIPVGFRSRVRTYLRPAPELAVLDTPDDLESYGYHPNAD